MSPTEEWLPVCRVAELEVERGASALVHGHAMAIFRTADDKVYALGNHDPFDRTARARRGHRRAAARAYRSSASPRHRHAFDLRTGRCLDDEHVSVPSYEVRVVEGVVLVGRRRERRPATQGSRGHRPEGSRTSMMSSPPKTPSCQTRRSPEIDGKPCWPRSSSGL